MKHRGLTLKLAALGVIALLLAGCGASVGTRGWAPATQFDNLVLLSARKGSLDAVNAQSNDLVWRFPRDWRISDGGARDLDGIYGKPVVSKDGRVVFIGDYNGYVYAFRPADSGQNDPPVGYVKLGDAVIGGLTLNDAGDTLYVASGSKVFSVSVDDLTRKIDQSENQSVDVRVSRLIDTGGEVWGRPVLAGGRLFVSSISGSLFVLNPETGEEIWRYSAGAGIATTPLTQGDTVLVAGFDRSLHAISQSDGSEVWRYETSNWIWAQPIIDGSTIYVADFDGYVSAVSMNDGSELWRKKVADSSIVASPVLTGGVLVVAGENGRVYGLDVNDQEVLWQSKLRKKVQADLVVFGGRVYVAPQGCVTQPELDNKVYYLSIDPSNGDLQSTGSVC